MIQHPQETEVRFKRILFLSFNLRELRGVGVKYLYTPARITKRVLIETIWRYFSTHIRLPQQTNNNNFIQEIRLPAEPNLNRLYTNHELEARDTQEEESHDISWYIDTTPSPISLVDGILLLQGMRSEYERTNINVNLMHEFDVSAHTQQIRKYNIRPVLKCIEDKGEVNECSICYENIKCIDMVELNCKHTFCATCITGSLKAHNNRYCSPVCALCRAQMTCFNVKNPEIYNLVSEHCL